MKKVFVGLLLFVLIIGLAYTTAFAETRRVPVDVHFDAKPSYIIVFNTTPWEIFASYDSRRLKIPPRKLRSFGLFNHGRYYITVKSKIRFRIDEGREPASDGNNRIVLIVSPRVD